ncbi:unnamed protein product [Zymoseptoria tritici ST99CH_1A5]|uniref:Uncharacterized protein n=1 Tax=Zymoseptoria tritici ST99CH_1A5 TaxID=1276529 RepID=A0A1Y6LGJ9_ZYMTR|nr:unnamed protein product [Zymoseptoria tritici ST99CH_1A5]
MFGQHNLLIALAWVAVFPTLASTSSAVSESPEFHRLPSLRDQAGLRDSWTDERLAGIPALLQKHGVDAWLISQREYAEDTAFWSMKRAIQFSARRRTLSLYVSANSTSKECHSQTWIDNTSQVYSELLEILEACDPSSIVVNTDADIAFASGLHAGEFEKLSSELGKKWSKRFVDKPIVAVEYIATMPASQLGWYRKLMETAWAIISEGFSNVAVAPGTTTTEDLEWWFREKIQSLNYTTWFQPSVTIVEAGFGFAEQPHIAAKTISYGDLLHVDFGVTALGLNTDTQHLAYVLAPGETESDIPHGLLEGLKTANRLQDIVRANMKPGLTGNGILATSLAQAKDNGISGKVYCHAIGDWGHSAGTVIGMTNLQDGVPVLGDLPLLENIYNSVELYAESWVPERNATLVFPLEEDVYWSEEKQSWEWVYARQEKYHLIKSEKQPGSLFIVQE